MNKTTPIVVPQQTQRPLWLLFWTIGLLMGLFAREIIAGPTVAGPGPGSSLDLPVISSQSLPPTTMVVEVHALLELPSPTPTRTPSPTPRPTQDPVPHCGRPDPGKICRVSLPPPTPAPTWTPYPSCFDDVKPGDICEWPTIIPDPLPGTPAPTVLPTQSPYAPPGSQR